MQNPELDMVYLQSSCYICKSYRGTCQECHTICHDVQFPSRLYVTKCEVSRWKQLACGSGCVASNLPNATIEMIQASLEEGEGSFRDIDVSCSGVDAESIVQVGEAFFQHVHIDEGNVYLGVSELRQSLSLSA